MNDSFPLSVDELSQILLRYSAVKQMLLLICETRPDYADLLGVLSDAIQGDIDRLEKVLNALCRFAVQP